MGTAVTSTESGTSLGLERDNRNILCRAYCLSKAQVAIERSEQDAPCAVDVPVDGDDAIADRPRTFQVLEHLPEST